MKSKSDHITLNQTDAVEVVTCLFMQANSEEEFIGLIARYIAHVTEERSK